MLVDLLELGSQGKQAHWNVVGKNFRDTHRQLDEIIEAAREFSDTVAERMRALHALPDGRSDTVAETTTLPEFPQGEIDTAEVVDLVTERLEAAVGTCRDVHDDVDEEDPTSADILHAILERLEQYAWMVSAENRKPAPRLLGGREIRHGRALESVTVRIEPRTVERAVPRPLGRVPCHDAAEMGADP